MTREKRIVLGNLLIFLGFFTAPAGLIVGAVMNCAAPITELARAILLICLIAGGFCLVLLGLRVKEDCRDSGKA